MQCTKHFFDSLTRSKVFFYIFNVAITGEHSRASVSPVNEMNEVDRVVSYHRPKESLSPISISIMVLFGKDLTFSVNTDLSTVII